MQPSLPQTALLNLILVTIAAGIGLVCIHGPLAANKVCDKSAPPPERAAALVAVMEDTEKLENLMR